MIYDVDIKLHVKRDNGRDMEALKNDTWMGTERVSIEDIIYREL